MLIIGGQAATVSVGGRILTDTVNLKVFRAYTNTNARSGFKQPDNTAYQVPVGKQLRIVGSKMLTANSSANGFMGCFGYADNSLGIDVATAATSPNYAYVGTTPANVGTTSLYSTTSERTAVEGFHNFVVPQSKYLVFERLTNIPTVCELYGYEEDT